MSSSILHSAFIGISALAAGFSFSSNPAHAGERVGKIWLQDGLPAEQVQGLQRDRAVLNRMKLSAKMSPELKSLLDVPSLSAADLNRWLEDRIQVVVADEYDADAYLKIIGPRADYENPGLFGRNEPSPLKPSGRKGITIMSNTGEWLYRRAKRAGELWAVLVPGVGLVPATSPRSGIISIGPGLFGRSYQVNLDDADADSNSIPRLSTFFHEARHSDGNGAELGFHHAVCPVGHSLAGYHSCDRSLNGSYTVGAVIVKALSQACARCSVSEREALKLMYLEKMGRVLTHELDGVTPVKAQDPKPEGKRGRIVRPGKRWPGSLISVSSP